MQAKLDVWVTQDPSVFLDEKTTRYYERNRVMIDLTCIPEEVRADVLSQFAAQEAKSKDRSKLFNYFIKMNLRHLMTDISQF